MTLVINSIILITVCTIFYANSMKNIFVNSSRLPLHTSHALYPKVFNEHRQFQVQLRHMHKVQKSTKDKHAPIKESATHCSLGAGSFWHIPSSQQHCLLQEARSEAICCTSRINECNKPCCFGPSFHVRSKDVQTENHQFLHRLAVLRNQKQHSINGNNFCSFCQNFLGTWYYYNCPKKFQSVSFPLKNGMQVHHSFMCKHHTSLWYFRRGQRIYKSFHGRRRFSINQQLVAAGATNGLPGDHGLSFKYYSIYQHNLPRYDQASGHESCRAAGGRTHQHLRSQTAIGRRHQKYNITRAQNRRAYRLWNANNKEWRSSTLVPIPVPPKKVHVSNYAQRRNYPRRIMTSISFTRTSLFKTYVKRDRLDEPQARLDNFAPPNRRMTLYSWNLESLLGVGKLQLFQQTISTIKVGIYALQETKSTQTDCLKFPKVHFYFSGSSQDPHAGVGFAIPTPLIPLVYDFHPWSSRIAVLILNTRPLRTALFSIYAPSQTQDSTFDHQRKTQFWNNLRTVYQTYSAEYTVIMMGDFNTRLYANMVQGLPEHIGNTLFSASVDDELSDSNNLHFFLDFLLENNLCVVSTMRPRPVSKLVTYQEISKDPPPPTSPTLDTYSVLDHVLCRISAKSVFRSISSLPHILLPWHHRHYLLKAEIKLPAFLPPRNNPHTFKRNFQDPYHQQLFRNSLLQQFSISHLSSNDPPFDIYTDGSCPDQQNISVTNPAGWGVYFQTLHLDLFGPVGCLPFPVVGSNNTAELQAPLEAIFYLMSAVSIPPRIRIFLDSQYVLDILQGRDVPTQNLPLVSMVLDYYTYLQTQSHVTLHKVKSHTGIEGNEKADLNANNGVNRRTYLGRYASFPPAPPPPLPYAPTQDIPPDQQTFQLVHALTAAMDSSFPKQKRNTRKPYITEHTLDLLSQVTPDTPPQTLKTLRNRIRKSALKDKKRWIQDRLTMDQSSSSADQWRTIKRLRTKYQHHTQSVNWPNGLPSTRRDKPEVLAQHLSTEVWQETTLPLPYDEPISSPHPHLDEPFTMVELYNALRRTKTGKAPGPDGIPMECFRLMPHPVKKILLAHYNDCFFSGVAPDHWKLAEVVMIFKGSNKNSRHPSSYRPISLANSIYKIYAAMLQQRLCKAIDPLLQPNQFGFRPQRSLATPLFLIRRHRNF